MVTLKEILTFQAENKISDLHLITGEVPCMRQKNSKIEALNDVPLTKFDIDNLLKDLLSETEQQNVKEGKGVDFAKEFDDLGRFRINVYHEVRGIGLNIRFIENDLIDIDLMEVPQQIRDMLNSKSGLFLIAGPGNSGKTTLLNSFIDYLNKSKELKIVSYEDPIEYVHKRKKSIVSQKELENSIEIEPQLLKSIFRQDADVVCLGEIRDYKTMDAALTLSEAGYFVIATLHSMGTVQGIERIVNLYPLEKKGQILARLANELKAFLSQTLLQFKNENKLIPCREIFIPDEEVRLNIKDGNLESVYTHMETAGKKGNILYDQYLVGLYQSGSITQEVLMKSNHNRKLVENFLVHGSGRNKYRVIETGV